MSIQDLLNKVNKTYKDAFGPTPTEARLNDTLKETFDPNL